MDYIIAPNGKNSHKGAQSYFTVKSIIDTALANNKHLSQPGCNRCFAKVLKRGIIKLMIVVDIEATGLDPFRHSIISIGALDLTIRRISLWRMQNVGWIGGRPRVFELSAFLKPRFPTE